MDIITRNESRKLGNVTYYTGKSCKRGHLSPRRVSNAICMQCAKEVYSVTDRDNYRYRDTFKRQFGARRQKALRDNIPFTITLEEIEKPKHCPVFGTELNYNWSGENRRDPNKATFDKLIPELGYVPGNVFVISWRANKLKSNMSIEELKKILKYIEENYNA